MEASAARMAKRSGHAVSVGQDARRERPATGMGSPERNANREVTQVDNLCYGGLRGAARAREPGYGSKRSQDGEAQRTCSECRAGCPTRTSGDGAWAGPSPRTNRKVTQVDNLCYGRPVLRETA